jgi:SAM-dependent methyltransferase
MSDLHTERPTDVYESYYGPAIFEPLTDLLLGHVPPRPGERVLDVACGTGIVTRRVAALVGEDARVVGVDVNPAMLETARAIAERRGLAIEWREGDGTALDLPDASFDLVTCQQGLQFFPDRPAGARHLRRVLADDGRAAVATWEGLDRHPLFAALTEAEAPRLAAHGVPVTIEELAAPFSMPGEELRTVLVDAGFRDVQVVQDSIVARFASPDRFVERLEFAYAAVVPAFQADPDAFAAYLAAIEQDTKPIIDLYRRGDHIEVPMHANIAIARP